MKTTSIILFIIATLSIGCKETCQDYPDKNFYWIPYSTKPSYKFVSENDTITFKVNNFYSSDEYKIDRRNDTECLATALFGSELIEELNIEISGYADNPSNLNMISYHYKFTFPGLINNKFYFSFENGLINGASSLQDFEYFDSLTLNSRTFTDVIHISKKEPQAVVNEVYISKTIGLVRFVTGSGVVWTIDY